MKNLVIIGVLAASRLALSAELPLVQDVDVLVVGGGVGAVRAASAARKAGAEVFLAAPRPQLGEDFCGPLRVWRDPEDDLNDPLACELFSPRFAPDPQLSFTYEIETPADGKNPDEGLVKLRDGRAVKPARDGVGFEGDAIVKLDLGGLRNVAGVELECFTKRRPAAKWRAVPKDLYNTVRLAVSTSEDGKSWSEWHDSHRDRGLAGGGKLLALRFSATCRYMRVKAVKQENVNRQLLAEVRVLARRQKPEQPADAFAPLHLKRLLDQELLTNGVAFLTGCMATDVLFDDKGRPSGAVIENRSGRQAVRAKVIVDATPSGGFARRAGCAFRPFTPGEYAFSRTVVTGCPPKADGLDVKTLPGTFPVSVRESGVSATFPDFFEARTCICTFKMVMKDGSPREFAEAEQRARDLTFTTSQLEAADTLEFTPPDAFVGGRSPFCPKGPGNVFVLGPRADIARDRASRLFAKVGEVAKLGDRIGGEAAAMARRRPAVVGLRPNAAVDAKRNLRAACEARRLAGWLCNTAGTVQVPDAPPPTLATCDVLVVGAGTAGAPAGIAAARAGAKTVVCEYLWNLGGVQTEGKVPHYYFGNCTGFTSEIDRGVRNTSAVVGQAKAEWYRRENRSAGAEIWLGTMASGVVLEGNVVRGVIVVAPDGTRGTVRCKAVVDATGNAVVAAAAGAPTEFIDDRELSVQGAGVARRAPGLSGSNNDIGFVDDTDAADLFYFSLRSRMSFGETEWDQASIVDSRERRRIRGRFHVTPADIMNRRTYSDTVVRAYSNFDTHGQTMAPEFFVTDPPHTALYVNVPYRCLLPLGIEGVIATGLGIGAHRDAMPVLRMQPDVQNEGYAAGYAAALAAAAGVVPSNVDVKALQSHLMEKGILPSNALDEADSFPVPDADFDKAVADLPDGYKGLEVLMTDHARAIPRLRAALTKTSAPADRLVYAHVLGILGDPSGAEDLRKAIRGKKWDAGWNFKGMSQFDRSVSQMDSYLIALGRSRAASALPETLALAEKLAPDDAYSHYRAVALALEGFGDSSAAPALAKLLSAKGVGGKYLRYGKVVPPVPNHDNAAGNKERTGFLKELCLARALYRLGDVDGLGRRTLEAYAADPRRALANHAQAVLEERTHVK